MEMLLKGGRVYSSGSLAPADVLVADGQVAAVGPGLAHPTARVVNSTGWVVCPGFTDLHVHLRQPGFEAKETIATGTAAAAAGGFTTVCAMPNLSPVPDSPEHLALQQAAIKRDATIQVLPYGALTVGEKGAQLADIEAMASGVCGYSDDGVGVQNEAMMRAAMLAVKKAGRLVAAHCEVDALLPENGTCVQAGSAFALRHGYTGHSNESEWREVERDIRLAEETGCRLHICHTSTAESLELVRAAKLRGVPVTCEVTPHNLLLSCDDIAEDDGRFKMNPPLRTPEDKAAALRALADGTADAVATDHAPHTRQDKAGGFAQSANGVVGLETAFPALYSGLVKQGALGLETLLARLCEGPCAVLGKAPPALVPGAPATLTVLALETTRPVDPDTFKSLGRSTPFAGQVLSGWPVLTLYGGQVAFSRLPG